MRVTKTYFMLFVTDMGRASRFYRDAFGLSERYGSPDWTELAVDGATLALHAGRRGGEADTGLGFEVDDLEEACRAVTRAGGNVVKPPEDQAGEGIRLATAADPEGNRFSLTQPVR